MADRILDKAALKSQIHGGAPGLLLYGQFEVGLVAATGTITCVDGASTVDTETFTIDDGTNPATEFEFDDNAALAGAGTAVTFVGTETAAEMAVLVAAAINGVGAGLAVTATVDSAVSNQVNLVNDAAGAAGTAALAETVADAGFVVDGMAGGSDGDILDTSGYGFSVAYTGVGIYTVTFNEPLPGEILHIGVQVYQDDAEAGCLWCVDKDFTTTSFVIRTFTIGKVAADVVGKVTFEVYARSAGVDSVQ